MSEPDPTPTDSASDVPGCGCADLALSRRRFLAGVGAAAGVGLVSSMVGDVFTQVAFGATPANPNVLVVLSLRGGCDGLSMVVPHGDPAYAAARPSIAVPRDALLAGDGMFGLHPKLSPLLPMWQSGAFGAVHAVGLPQPNRSHFQAMEAIEDADPGSAERRGWINRLAGVMPSSSPAQAVQLGGAMLPTALYGVAPVLGLDQLSDVRLPGSWDDVWAGRVRRSQHRVWDGASGVLGRAVRSALTTTEDLAVLGTVESAPQNGAVYPNIDLGRALEQTATLIRADVGTRVVTVDFGGWDMHTGVGTLGWGDMQSVLGQLAASVAAFFTDLGTLMSQVTVITISEFGRRVAENGSGGLDHGFGNCMLLLGGGVQGGTVHATWPGLGDGSLIQGDLQVTLDYRSVLSAVLRSRFPEVDVSAVFPGFLPEPVAVMA